MSEELWYQDGLRFQCTRCGNCCRGGGYVWVDESETRALAQHLKMNELEFEAVYTRKVGRSRSLREKANDDCIFYDEHRGCSVYEARPQQCRTWPFWDSNVKTEEAWNATKKHCPGCGEGELFSVDEITTRLAKTKL